MGDVRVSATGKFPPERFVAALTDFSAEREKLFGNSQGGYLKVHGQGPDWADVTEGSTAGGGIWQRYRYDWSRPGEVRLEVLDSNTFGKGSYWEYHVTPDGSGGSRVAPWGQPITNLIDAGAVLTALAWQAWSTPGSCSHRSDRRMTGSARRGRFVRRSSSLPHWRIRAPGYISDSGRCCWP